MSDTPRSATVRELRDELRQLHRHGRLVVGVDGYTADRSAFADDLAAALAADGTTAYRAHAGAPEAAADARLRDDVVAPFRAGTAPAGADGKPAAPVGGRDDAGADAVVVVDGPQLHAGDRRGLWNWSVWLEAPLPSDPADPTMPDRAAYEYASKERPARRASAVVDDSDPEHPKRVFSDFC